jgi:hypothetical protein
MILTAEQRARIAWVITYLNKGSAGNLDQKAIQELIRVFGCGQCAEFGFPTRGCMSSLEIGFRDSPTETLLRLLLCSSCGVGDNGAFPEPSPFPPEIPAGLDQFYLPDCNYGVLAGEAVLNTDGTYINGSLGIAPGVTVTNFPPGVVANNTDINNAAAIAAKLALDSAYLTAEAMNVPAPTIVAGDIGGSTLLPGIYKSLGALAITGSDLVLDGLMNLNSYFLFQIAGNLTTDAARQIILINGAQPEHIIFQIGGSATFGTGNFLRGTFMALNSITAGTMTIVEGQLLARNGAVTLDTNLVLAPCPNRQLPQ